MCQLPRASHRSARAAVEPWLLGAAHVEVGRAAQVEGGRTGATARIRVGEVLEWREEADAGARFVLGRHPATE